MSGRLDMKGDFSGLSAFYPFTIIQKGSPFWFCSVFSCLSRCSLAKFSLTEETRKPARLLDYFFLLGFIIT